MKPILCFLLSLTFVQSQSGEIDNFFSSTDQFFKKYVAQGKVDYALIKKNKTQIDGLVQCIGSMNLAAQAQSSKKAFYINAYNVLVISLIVEVYPVKSPMVIPGFFDK